METFIYEMGSFKVKLPLLFHAMRSIFVRFICARWQKTHFKKRHRNQECFKKMADYYMAHSISCYDKRK